MLINHYSIIQLFKFLNIHFRIISIERYTFDTRKLLPLPTKNMVVGKCFQTVKRFPIRIPDFHGCFVLKISFTGLHLPNKNLLHNKKVDQGPPVSEQQIVSMELWNSLLEFRRRSGLNGGPDICTIASSHSSSARDWNKT